MILTKKQRIELPEVSDRVTVGIPRGLLYYRYKTLWLAFFRTLGVKVVLSTRTTLNTSERGAALAADEACLALKIYMGHVEDLSGRCDYIFVPRICGYGRNLDFCVRFQALYDLCKNAFRDSGQKFLLFHVDAAGGVKESDSLIAAARSLGFSNKAAKLAYTFAKHEEERVRKEAARAQEALFGEDGLKILIAAHSYVTEDAYIGKPITDFLKKCGAVPIRADLFDRQAALRRSAEISPTCKWMMNREILGGIALNISRVDGIVLISTFPCGSDAMVNDILLRKVKDVPVLNLVLDGQSGTAGLETRLESFLDIIRFKRGLL